MRITELNMWRKFLAVKFIGLTWKYLTTAVFGLLAIVVLYLLRSLVSSALCTDMMWIKFLYVAHLLSKVYVYHFSIDSTFSYVYQRNNAMHKHIATISDIPYHVLIAHNSLYCSGSLIRSRLVVTVASCFFNWNKNQRISVKVGAESVTGIGQVIEVVELKKHEFFNHNDSMDNDIALLMLKDHVTFSKDVQKILLVEPDVALRDDTPVDVSGWGSAILQPPKISNSLLWSEMTVLNKEECKVYYPELMYRSNFCVKYAPERGLCDNGGPAVFRDTLVGVLSFGAANIEEPFVAVLTNVSYFHRWIMLNTKRFMMKYCVSSKSFSEYDLSDERSDVKR